MDIVSLNTQGLAAGSYPLQIGLAAPGETPDITLAIANGGPWYSVGTVNITDTVSSTVVQTKLFYKGSTAWDINNNNLAGFSNDNAIAPDKSAYLPGTGRATFANVSSYTKGVNGLMIDIQGSHGALSANDFTFNVGNNNSPNLWATVTPPTLVTTRVGAGASGSDRVELLWADNAIEKTWLQVIVEGNDALGGFNTNTGLANSYVFYFGSAPGDTGTGNTATAFVVNPTDAQSVRNNPKSVLDKPAAITDVNDFNRDGNVNSTDQQVPRNYVTAALTTALGVLSINSSGPFAPLVAATPASLDGSYGSVETSDIISANLAFGLAIGAPSLEGEVTMEPPRPVTESVPSTAATIEASAPMLDGTPQSAHDEVLTDLDDLLGELLGLD